MTWLRYKSYSMTATYSWKPSEMPIYRCRLSSWQARRSIRVCRLRISSWSNSWIQQGSKGQTKKLSKNLVTLQDYWSHRLSPCKIYLNDKAIKINNCKKDYQPMSRKKSSIWRKWIRWKFNSKISRTSWSSPTRSEMSWTKKYRPWIKSWSWKIAKWNSWESGRNWGKSRPCKFSKWNSWNKNKPNKSSSRNSSTSKVTTSKLRDSKISSKPKHHSSKP